MSVNKFRPHVLLIPEDDANRQIANGFVQHEQVATRMVQIMGLAHGWRKAMEQLEETYTAYLAKYPHAHIVFVVDFDEDEDRARLFHKRVPEDLRDRVFAVGSRKEPEVLRQELNLKPEAIGYELAAACFNEDYELWQHPHLAHNQPELERLLGSVRGILFA